MIKRPLLAVAAGVAILALSALAIAQTMPQHGDHFMPGMAGPQTGGMMGHGAMGHGGLPTLPGQDAFGAVQEIVRILEADPDTNWSKVDLEALRQHLIDMNLVTLEAKEEARPIEGGVEIAVTGAGRTLDAIRRMVPAQAHELDGLHGWSAKAAPLPEGVQLTVTTSDAKDVAHIRGLGFIGLMASGSHHQMHHLMMAKGEFPMH